MKCLKKLITIALCCIIFINNSNIAYANTDNPIASAESTNDMYVQIYKVPVISNECTGSNITFYGYNGKFYLALDDIKDFTRYKFNESDSHLILGHGIREIRIEKATGHLTDCNCVDQGIIDILEYNGKYLCEGIPMLTYLGADCTVKDGKALEILMPSFTIWESVMPDYSEYYFDIAELYGGESNIIDSMPYDIAHSISCMMAKEIDEYHFSDAESLNKLKEMFSLYYQTVIALSENIAASTEVSGESASDYATMYLHRITNCTVVPIVDFSALSDDLLIPEWMEFFEAQPLSEKELLVKTRATAGYPMMDYVYVDMDHDGLKELIGVADSDEHETFKIWYCSNDSETCLSVYQNSNWFEDFTIELLEFNNETHVAINFYNLWGTSKKFSIISLKNGEACIRASEEWGYVYMSKNGEILLDVEGYDGIYDPDTGHTYSHTWIDTYLCFDGESYKEYIAYEITESEYLNFINAQDIKDRIADKLTESDTIELEYKYFKRKNNILHIQCNVHQSSGTIYYGYYTVRYSDNVLDEQFVTPDNQSDAYNPGRMYPRLSYFEAAP